MAENKWVTGGYLSQPTYRGYNSIQIHNWLGRTLYSFNRPLTFRFLRTNRHNGTSSYHVFAGTT